MRQLIGDGESNEEVTKQCNTYTGIPVQVYCKDGQDDRRVCDWCQIARTHWKCIDCYALFCLAVTNRKKKGNINDKEQSLLWALKDISRYLNSVESLLTVEEAAEWFFHAVQLLEYIKRIFCDNHVTTYVFVD